MIGGHAIAYFTEEQAMVSLGLILAIALASVHAFMARLPIFSIIPRFRWTSFAGGVSISFVFLEIFPELSHAKEKLEHTDIPLLHSLENQFHFVALLGLLVFYGLGLLAMRTKSLGVHEKISSQFWGVRCPAGKARKHRISGYYEFSQHRRTGCIGVQNVRLLLSEPLGTKVEAHRPL
jgi:hypothetical protein